MEKSSVLRELGQRIASLREKRKWSQEKLAQRIQVPRSRLSKWERGENGLPLEHLIELSKALGVTVDELTVGPKEKATETPALPPEVQEELAFHMKALGRLLKDLVKPNRRVSGANSGRRNGEPKGGSR